MSSMTVLTTRQEVAARLGDSVQIAGIAVNTKAAAALQLDCGGTISCGGALSRWPSSVLGLPVTVTATVRELSEPAAPVATQDEHGAWSQGVVVPQRTELVRAPDGQISMVQTVVFDQAELSLKVSRWQPRQPAS